MSDYTIGSNFDITDFQTPSSNLVELPINKSKKFLVRIDTVDRAQHDIDAAEVYSTEAAMQMKIAVDKDVIQNVGNDAAAENKGATAGAISANLNLGTDASPVSITTANAVSFLLDLGQAMDEQNIGDEGRWVALPAWFIRKLKDSTIRTASTTGDAVSPLRNGKVGMVDRFAIYQSNNLKVAAGVTDILAGHSAGLAFAAQFTELNVSDNPLGFGQLMKGLCVYGYKTIEPKFLFQGKASPGAG